jgi:hypothetical protein
MDSSRLFVFDYEYGEIANFSRDYGAIEDRLYSIFYGEYTHGLEGYYRIAEESEYDLTVAEKTWKDEIYAHANEVFDIVKELSRNSLSEVPEGLTQHLEEIQNLLEKREEESKEIMQKREETRLRESGEHGAYHPIEGIHKFCRYTLEQVTRGLEDVQTYEDVVKPQLEEFKQRLPTDINAWDREYRIKQEELSILNALKLTKKTEESHVIVGIFPFLPISDESMDRVICSYSISTHVIPEADIEDFRSWLREIQRVLKPGGKAYIFPMQQGFPFGRTYDEDALYDALDEFSPKAFGNLEYTFYENPNNDAWRQDTTLIITKKP